MQPLAFIDVLNRTYFEGRLSAPVIDALTALPVHRDDARAFLERACRLMHRAGHPAEDVSPFQGALLGSLLSRLLPGTWEGRVPPITVAGRHRQIDALVATQYPTPSRFIDIACGFPPVTTVDSAAALPGWQILGVDRSLPRYLVYDGLGNYAVFDEDRRAQYFQPVTPTGESWTALLEDWEGTRTRFERLLHSLLDPAAAGAAPDGATLTHDPAVAYQQPGLRFVRADLSDLRAEPAAVVRCFNMLLYFDDAFRTQAIAQCGKLLADGGLFVCGTDWASTTEARYFTYRKEGGSLLPQEFAFTLDNVTPFGVVSWYALHDDDREANLLAECCGALNGDAAFAARNREVGDRLRAEAGLCPRGADGYHGELAASVDPTDLWRLAAEISDRLGAELGEQAVEVLSRSGRAARVNEVGHVAISIAPD